MKCLVYVCPSNATQCLLADTGNQYFYCDACAALQVRLFGWKYVAPPQPAAAIPPTPYLQAPNPWAVTVAAGLGAAVAAKKPDDPTTVCCCGALKAGYRGRAGHAISYCDYKKGQDRLP